MTADDATFLADLGLWVRVLRTARRLSQDRLAETANVSRVTLGSTERGEHAAGILACRSIAAALEVPLSELFDDSSRLGHVLGEAQREPRPPAAPTTARTPKTTTTFRSRSSLVARACARSSRPLIWCTLRWDTDEELDAFLADLDARRRAGASAS
jgi:DNA-binding XRE family transcriptional regulator